MANKIKDGIEYIESQDKIAGVQDDQFIALRDELMSIRMSRTMYVGDSGAKGAFHLFKEVFNNALDEMNNEANAHKKVKRIYVSFSEKQQKFTVLDEGRGIPMDNLVDAVMTKHYTTKSVAISTSRNKKQTGLHGVGMTVVAALTDYMSLTTFRGNHYKKIVLNDGQLTELPEGKLDEPQLGLLVELIPSEKWLGECHISNDTVADFIRNMSYIVDPDIEITLTLEDAPKKGRTQIYKNAGLSECVKFMSSTLEFPPVEAKVSTKDYDLSMAFSFDRGYDETAVTSFCNFVITDFGGSHEALAQTAICSYLVREAKRLEPNARQEITFDDCKNGLIFAVNLEHIAPAYESQNKERVSNKFGPDDRKLLIDAIYAVMNNNPGVLKKAINYLRNVAKARQEAHKIKGVVTKKKTTFLEDAAIPKFFPVTDRNGSGYRELFLAEGDSAAGGLLNCRNPLYQAVLTINGVTDNVYGLSLTQFLQKQTFRNLTTVLGCGVGKTFDIRKLKYDKVIICTDKDIDGNYITSLLLCCFLIFFPELIYAGKIYKAMPPLYLMDEKSIKKYNPERLWLYDKWEYYHLYHRIIADNTEVWLEHTPLKAIEKNRPPKFGDDCLERLNKRQTLDWLNLNAEYMLELNNFEKKATGNAIILETIAYYKTLFQRESDFERHILDAFPEMNYDTTTHTLRGSLNSEHFTLICDNLFMRSASRYIKQMVQNPSIYIWFRQRGTDDKPVRCTIGEFLALMQDTIKLKIDQRFKGVGEAEAPLLFKTTTNPRFRKLHRITIGDIDKDKEVFELLHGKSPDLREQRRLMLDEADISLADIDN